MSIVSYTFKSATNSIIINDVEYPKNVMYAIYGLNTVIIKIVADRDTIVPFITFDQIKNGDTGSSFASMSDLKTYISANFFK